MRIAIVAVCLICSAGMAWAQAQPDKKPDGTTVSPEASGQSQPQGKTGPINTTTGGAPAESPQGETPPGMQSAPDGSSKKMVAPAK